MNKLTYKARQYELRQYESVLDCLLRNAQPIPYACRAGMCQACLIRAVDCDATAESRKWIKPSLQALGYTLACQWVPQGDVAAELPGIEDFSLPVRIDSIRPLNDRVMQVLLAPEEPAGMFAYRPGQYLSLINPQGITRSYSIANDYEQDGVVELHIGATAHGVFTHWLFNEAAAGDRLHMRGPAGECFFNPAEIEGQEVPLLLAGTGTGLAPLLGILRDALAHGHGGPIQLFHGAGTADRLYLVEALQALADDHPHVHYFPCVREDATPGLHHAGSLEAVLETQVNPKLLAQARVYLCGAPDFVHGMRKRLFLKGARSAHIHCDPFTERNVPEAPTT